MPEPKRFIVPKLFHTSKITATRNPENKSTSTRQSGWYDDGLDTSINTNIATRNAIHKYLIFVISGEPSLQLLILH